MKNLSSKITKVEFLKIDSFYKQYKQKNLKNENLLALYKTKNLTISVFKNFTLLLQGDDIAIASFNSKTKSKNDKVKISTTINGTIGMDEVGTGDYFGPVVTCACYVSNKNIDKIKDLKVNDSKKIDDKQIKSIAKLLKKYVVAETCVCMPKTYNKMIKQFDNSNLVKAVCHNQSLTKLVSKLKENKYQIILDQFVSEDNYYNYLQKAKVKAAKINVFETKAESKYLSVACASIIARDTFLSYMDKLSKELNCTLPRGSVEKKKIISIGKQIIKKGKLDNYAKLHFESITDEIIGCKKI